MSRLRALRRQFGSLELVSEKLNIDASHLSRIERGIQRPSPELAEVLSGFFAGKISEMEILYPERYIHESGYVK